jgi:exodeoxyribonuclease-5
VNSSDKPIIICSTARLARSLKLAHGREQRALGLNQWQPLQALTLDQWLGNTMEQALLQGQIALDEVPHLVLNNGQELLLWERVIERMLIGDAAALFDRNGLAKAAQEANWLMQEWNIAVAQGNAGEYNHAEEVEQFLRWRSEFRKQCKVSGWLESVRFMDWQIAQMQKGKGDLPAQIFRAGYDRISPQERRLFDALSQRGVSVKPWSHLLQTPSAALQIGLADAEAECRAAVAWAADKLLANPDARLAIVAPELASLRERLTALLDDNLHPAALSPALAETARSYDLSLGAALSRQPLVSAALDLLRLASRRRNLGQQDFSCVLLGPYWSASSTEVDARAQLDARMRAHLPVNVTLERLLRFAKKQQERGLGVSRLADDLQAFLDVLTQLPARQLPSQWAQSFINLLQAINWPGERSLSSHEYQAHKAFNTVIASLADFDTLSGALTLAQAVQRLSQMCADQVFQTESQDYPQILVMGMLETVAAPLDAMWVMGMNDHVWPPAARPNPLLPANLQRAARAPNADGPVQAEFARAIHQRLLLSANEIVFSWAHKSGESELRVSPLLHGIPQADQPENLAATLAEKLTVDLQTNSGKQWLDDHVAPPATAGEKVSGGAGLIRAQAICPAWAYYRYRLGARPLEEPVEGLDAMDRGSLVHAVLQSFWQGHDSDYLNAMDEAALRVAILNAVEEGMQRFSNTLEEPLPPNFLVLEKQRLQFVLAAWLAYEKERPPFTVELCEERAEVNIAGLKVNLTLDRVDRLPDGKLVVIDYKTGSVVSHNSWADARITEPQLPIYSALALAGKDIAAVCFAQVRADEQRFIGVAAEAGTLPGVKALHEAGKLFPPEAFANWTALIAHWKSSIETIANELMAGESGVVFQDEKDLLNCDVLPILRLPERYLQIETSQAAILATSKKAAS